ncbi:MAG: MBL fold metallo-hydrolase [Rubrivivax sp.]|nr:MAG: MBL fold metallo-hydrolase [Rubrivivax sp.]
MFAKALLSWPLALAALCAHAAPTPAQAPSTVTFAIVKTGTTSALKGMMVAGGGFTSKVDSNFSAILVRHGQTHFLFDTGLGTQVASQYQQDMPWWMRPFFKYEGKVLPARLQLDQAGVPPVERIYLSHAHWDHASGLVDFPQAQVWTAAEEQEAIHAGIGKSWPSQVGAKSIQWQRLAFKPQPYQGFERSLDVFSDGTVVLVPLFGHTPGSIGMFLTTDSGKRFFFCGDAVWRAEAVQSGSPKFWLASLIVDNDAPMTQRSIEQMRELTKRDPALVIVPAHDEKVQSALGYFPQWVK